MLGTWQPWAHEWPREASLPSPSGHGGQRWLAAPAAASGSAWVPLALAPCALPQASSSPGPEVCKPGPRSRQAPGVGQAAVMAVWGAWQWWRTMPPPISDATARELHLCPHSSAALLSRRTPGPPLPPPRGFAFRATCPPGVCNRLLQAEIGL